MGEIKTYLDPEHETPVMAPIFRQEDYVTCLTVGFSTGVLVALTLLKLLGSKSK